MPGRLDGKVALVTGGARGQGKAEAELFAEEGATVVVTDVLADEGRAVADGIVSAGGEATFHEHDVAEEAEWERVVEATLDEFGSLDVLVNNAGVIGSMATVTEETVEDWERTIAINQRGVWLGMKHAIPPMLDQGNGSIINVSSIWGVAGVQGSVAYQASKGAVRIMTKNAAVTYGADGVRTNSIHPGFIETPMTENLDETREAMVGATPMSRAGEPEEIAPAALFLASDEASYVNGAELYVDGGFLAP
jgi:cyclopentanol dehydrogenase